MEDAVRAGGDRGRRAAGWVTALCVGLAVWGCSRDSIDLLVRGPRDGGAPDRGAAPVDAAPIFDAPMRPPASDARPIDGLPRDTGVPPLDAAAPGAPEAGPPDPCAALACGLPTPACDPVSLQCVQCTNDFYCPRPWRCDTTAHRCVQCLENADCRFDEVCVQERHQCARPCTSTLECNRPFGVPLQQCDPQSGLCVRCVTNDDCPYPTSCRDQRCVQCVEDSECSTGHCNELGICVCYGNEECPDGLVCVVPGFPCVQPPTSEPSGGP